MEKVAVLPGSFDPITNGHLDLVDRGLKVFDRIIIAAAVNQGKQSLFSMEERLAMIRESIADHPFHDRLEADSIKGLLVDYVRNVKADAILRGMRVVSDFEWEFQMALMNRKLDRDIETFFLMTGMRWIFISSRIIKEVVRSGGSVAELVPPPVEKRLIERLRDPNLDQSGAMT